MQNLFFHSNRCYGKYTFGLGYLYLVTYEQVIIVTIFCPLSGKNV